MAYRKRRQPPSALRFLGRLALAALKLGLLAALSAVAVGMWLFYEYSADLPAPEQLSRHHPFETTRIYARDGQTLLFELVDPTAGRRTVVPFQRIPRALKDATVAVEDAGFYTNPGVDLRGIVARPVAQQPPGVRRRRRLRPGQRRLDHHPAARAPRAPPAQRGHQPDV